MNQAYSSAALMTNIGKSKVEKSNLESDDIKKMAQGNSFDGMVRNYKQKIDDSG